MVNNLPFIYSSIMKAGYEDNHSAQVNKGPYCNSMYITLI